MSEKTVFGSAASVVTAKKNINQVIIQAIIVGVSAVITWLIGNQADIDFGQYSTLIVAALTLLGNFLKEWMANYFNGKDDEDNTPPSPVI